MNQAIQTAEYSAAAYRNAAMKNDWMQVLVFVLLAITILSTLVEAAYCISKGGSMEWAWKFGVFVQIACKFGR